MSLTTLSSIEDIEGLARGLLDPGRVRPVCVLSTPPGSATSLIDVAALAEGCGDLADIVVVPTGEPTWRFAALLPPRCAVWGGAARVYPPGVVWQTDPLRSPLRFVYAPEDARRAGERLLEDALGMSASTPARAGSAVRQRSVRGVVQRVVSGGARAFVLTDGDELVTVSSELQHAGVPLDWYLDAGLTVAGAVAGPRTPMRLASLPVSDRSLLQHFGPGVVTLALVHEVRRQDAVVLLHPDVPVPVRRADISSNPRDLVDHLLGEGEVVPVRIVRDPQGRLRVRLDDVEDDEALVPALPLVADGPPWLVDGRDLVTARVDEEAIEQAPEAFEPVEPGPPAEPAPIATVARPGPRPGPRVRVAAPVAPPPPAVRSPTLQQALLQIEALKGEVRRLQQTRTEAPAGTAITLELGQERARVADLQSRLRDAQRESADLRKRARGSSAAKRAPSADLDRFDDEEEWIRHEVLLTWIERFDSAERRRHSIGDGWSIGPQFAGTLRPLPDSQLRKAFRAVVDVVVGLDASLASRELHQLRSGLGGDDPPLLRATDGATCWRVAVESNVPSALRLHYWRTRSGLELSRIVQHDDFRP